MKSILALILFIFCLPTLYSQIDFEIFDLEEGTFLNDAENDMWEVFDLRFPNVYDPTYNSFFHWAVSAMNDPVTPGFENQYASIAGKGNNGSDTYMVAYNFNSILDPTRIIIGQGQGAPMEMYVSNNSYAYYSMLNGDSFAKKFGGVDGTDPDYFYVSFKGVKDGLSTGDSLNFYLADYRFEDNSEDYIIDDWTAVDLTPLGIIDEIHISWYSSDTGAFGVNTPTYLCIDDFEYEIINSIETQTEKALSIYPNPVQQVLYADVKVGLEIQIYDMVGQCHYRAISTGDAIDVSGFSRGTYLLCVGAKKQLFIKQ